MKLPVKKKVFCHQKFYSMMTSATIMLALIVVAEMVDVLIAGHLFGGRSISSVHLISPLLLVATFASIMVAGGTKHNYIYLKGQFKMAEAKEAAGQGLILAVICSAVLFAWSFAIKTNYLESVTYSTKMANYAWPYYTFVPYLFVLYPFYFLFQELVYNDGGGKWCVYATVLQVAVNICASYVLGRIMGMAGLSLGTLLGFLTSIIVYLTWFLNKHCTIRFKWHFEWKDVWEVFQCSYATASLALYAGIRRMILNKFVTLHFGGKWLSSLTVVSSVMILSLLFEGIAQAAEPMANIYYSEKNPDGIKKLMKHVVWVALIAGLIVSFIMIIFNDSLPKLYGIRPKPIIDMSSMALCIIAPAMPFISLMYLFAAYYSVTGHIGITFKIAPVRDLMLGILCPVVFGSIWGMKGLWIGILASHVSAFALFSIILVQQYGKRFPLLLPEKDIVSKDFVLTPETLLKVRDWIGKECNKRNIASNIRTRLEVMIEDMGMLIINKNKGHSVLAEISIRFKHDIKVVMRDDGVPYNVTDPDAALSFRSIFVDGLIRSSTMSHYLLTQNYNRNIFHLKREARGESR